MTKIIKNEQLILKLNRSGKNEECVVYLLENNNYYYFLGFTMQKERYFKILADNNSIKSFEFYRGVEFFDEKTQQEVFANIVQLLKQKHYLKIKPQNNILAKFSVELSQKSFSTSEAQHLSYKFLLSTDDEMSEYNYQFAFITEKKFNLCVFKGNAYYRMCKYTLEKSGDAFNVVDYEYYHPHFKNCRLSEILFSKKEMRPINMQIYESFQLG